MASMAAPKRAIIDCLKKCIGLIVPLALPNTHKEIVGSGFLNGLSYLSLKYQQNHVLTKKKRGTHKEVFW
jgi:hypothetical protein